MNKIEPFLLDTVTGILLQSIDAIECCADCREIVARQIISVVREEDSK